MVRCLILSVGVTLGPLCAATAGAQVSAGGQWLVTPQWLAQHQHDRDLVILEVGRAVDECGKDHIPGTRCLTYGALESTGSSTGGTGDINALPTEAQLERNLEQFGISGNSHVVVTFAARGVATATRAMFVLAYAGLEHVSLLDGGTDAWKQAGYPMTSTASTVTPGHLTVHVKPTLVADHAWVQSHEGASHNRLVDARAAVYYDGPSQGRGSTGHIPSAVSLPYTSLFNDAAVFLPPGDLEQRFRAAGVLPGDTVITYCHVGVQATVVALAARMLGHPTRVYLGSFHDWDARKLPTEGGKP